jgi:hypothetical protein
VNLVDVFELMARSEPGTVNVIDAARSLLEGGDPKGTHPEYERALVEITLRFAGLEGGEFDLVEAIIWDGLP